LNPLEAIASELVFTDPWQAQAFALAVQLSGRGAFSWGEWASALSAEIAALGPSDGTRYYEAWLAALESLVTSKGLVQPAELTQRRCDWEEAHRSTPHGAPVELQGRRLSRLATAPVD